MKKVLYLAEEPDSAYRIWIKVLRTTGAAMEVFPNGSQPADVSMFVLVPGSAEPLIRRGYLLSKPAKLSADSLARMWRRQCPCRNPLIILGSLSMAVDRSVVPDAALVCDLRSFWIVTSHSGNPLSHAELRRSIEADLSIEAVDLMSKLRHKTQPASLLLPRMAAVRKDAQQANLSSVVSTLDGVLRDHVGSGMTQSA